MAWLAVIAFVIIFVVFGWDNLCDDNLCDSLFEVIPEKAKAEAFFGREVSFWTAACVVGSDNVVLGRCTYFNLLGICGGWAMIFCVGLTGGLASGKTTVASFFAELGAKVIDADEIGRTLTAPDGLMLPALRAELGDWAFDEDGGLQRKAVGARAFSDDKFRRKLESILHPPIIAEMQRQAVKAEGPYMLLSAPLLLETGTLVKMCSRILLIDCPEETQIERACLRDGMSAEEAKLIIGAQMPRGEKKELSSDIITNDGDLPKLKKAAEVCHEELLSHAKEFSS